MGLSRRLFEIIKDWIIVIILAISVISVLIFIFSDRNSDGLLEEGFYDEKKKVSI